MGRSLLDHRAQGDVSHGINGCQSPKRIISSDPLAATLAAALRDVNRMVLGSTPARGTAIAGISGMARFEILI